MQTFAHPVMTEYINRGMRLLSKNANCDALDLVNDVLEKLSLRHPTASSKLDNLLLIGPVIEAHNIVFDNFSQKFIQKAVIRTKVQQFHQHLALMIGSEYLWKSWCFKSFIKKFCGQRRRCYNQIIFFTSVPEKQNDLMNRKYTY